MLEFQPRLVACVIINRNDSFAMLNNRSNASLMYLQKKLQKKWLAVIHMAVKPINSKSLVSCQELVDAPLIDECYANLECRVTDTRMEKKYCMFVLEVIHAWIDFTEKNPRTIHHQGKSNFMTAGERIKLKSKVK